MHSCIIMHPCVITHPPFVELWSEIHQAFLYLAWLASGPWLCAFVCWLALQRDLFADWAHASSIALCQTTSFFAYPLQNLKKGNKNMSYWNVETNQNWYNNYPYKIFEIKVNTSTVIIWQKIITGIQFLLSLLYKWQMHTHVRVRYCWL